MEWVRRFRGWRRGSVAALLALTLMGDVAGPVRPALADTTPRPYNVTLLFTSDPAPLLESVVTDGTVAAWIDADGALIVHTLATKQERRVLDGPARRAQLALAGGTLVWIERAAQGGAAVRGLRLDGGDPFTIAAGAGERNGPAIAGSMVVWRDRRGGNWDIYGYDLNERREFAISTEPGNQGAVAIAGARVVWEDRRAGRWNLWTYDLTTRQETALTTGPDDDLTPALDGQVLAFVRQRTSGGFGALVLRDLATGEERVIAEGHLVLRPALAGNLVVWEDWRGGAPNIYAYDREARRAFLLTRSEQARDPRVGGSVVTWLSKGQFSGRVTAIRLDRPLPSDPVDPPTVTDPNARYFAETKHNLAGAFRNFWSLNGGLAAFGYPLTEEFSEPDTNGRQRQVQYFERVRLEADPDDATTIRIGRLGAEQTRGRAFPTVPPFENTAERVYVAQTQHGLGGRFKVYWEAHGSLALFGFPISEEMQEGDRTVQYFERARLELTTDASGAAQVRAALLGREELLARGWLPSAPADRSER